jgi:hypothetical protein
MAIALLVFASNGAIAEEPADKPKGKPVILRVGPGFDLSDANVMADLIESEGCPTTVTIERGLPTHTFVNQVF